MTLQLTPELEEALSMEARRRRTTPEKLAIIMLQRGLDKSAHAVSPDDDRELNRLMAYAGVLDSGDANSADDDRIDADLAREYARGL